MQDNIINIKHKNLETELKSHAENLSSDVPITLRENLFAKLAEQNIAPVEQQIKQQSNYFNRTLAIAASVLFSFIALQIFTQNNSLKPEQAQIASFGEERKNQPIKLKLPESSSIEQLTRQKLMAANGLNDEYAAILADIQKVKQKITEL